jgi:hypothetical protein
MTTFIELSVHIEKQRWEKRSLNMSNCIAMKEHDATVQFKKRPVVEPFASQPLVCLLTMVYPDGSVEKLWVHSSLHSILTKIGYANHASGFTPAVDMAAIEREWERKSANSSHTPSKFNLMFPAR